MELPPERRLTLFIESDELLRKPKTAKQRARFKEEESAFQNQAQEQAAALGFVALSGPVSIHLHTHAPQSDNQPQIPPVAKAYLDAMQGIAYEDDRQVEHLVVRQDTLAHPMMDGFTPAEDESTKAAVFVEVEPLKDYTMRYDRALRATWWRRGPSPWRRSWTLRKEIKFQRYLSQLNALASGTEENLQALVHSMGDERLRSGVLADIDRPGPLPSVTQAIHRVLPAHRIHWRARREAGATFLLPQPGQGPGSSHEWKASLEHALSEFRSEQSSLPFDGFVALDIAARGSSLEGKDLDNLAHAILAPLEESLCVRRGTVVAFRVYTAVGEPQGVQVRVLDHSCLLALDIALGEAEIRPPADERLREWLDRFRDRAGAAGGGAES